MTWSAIPTADGSSTLVHPVHGEACHSRAGAWQEARERYAAECRLGEFRGASLRLLDVGTGIGLNLAAALEALEPVGVPLHAVTLERDREAIESGLALAQPPQVERWLAPVRTALRAELARSSDAPASDGSPLSRGRLHLLLGDARTNLPALDERWRFDAVFLDPFSPRVEPDLWSPEFLGEVARRMARGSRLSTYSAASRVRAALAAAGLRVTPGARVGTKREGTLASPDVDLSVGPAETRPLRET